MMSVIAHSQLPAFASDSLEDARILLSGPGASGSLNRERALASGTVHQLRAVVAGAGHDGRIH
jgi:hypothetical protein